MSKPHRFWRTLRFRFAVWLSVFLLVILVAFGIFLYRRLEHNMSNAVDDALRTNARQVAAFIDFNNTDSPAQPLQDRSVSVRVFNVSGEMVYGTGSYQNIDTAIIENEAYQTLNDPFDPDDRIRLFSTPVQRDGEFVGTVQTIQSLEIVAEPLEQLLILLEISVPLFVLIIGIGGYWLAGRALAPIDHITETAAQISTDDLSTRLDLPPADDEVGRLASTFNVMLSRLEDAFQREKQFTSDASHELRTPLAAIRTITELTLNRPRSSAEYETALHDILAEVLRMQTLAEDLLRLARQDGFDTVHQRERIDIGELVQDIVESMRPLAETTDLTLTANVTEKLYVAGDPGALMRLVTNLVDNAIKYTSSGAITVTVQRGDKSLVKVVIQDTGIGISENHLPHLFERFYRADPARTASGSGLGLTIAKAIAHAHGGELTVQSQEDVGTTCVFTIPLIAT